MSALPLDEAFVATAMLFAYLLPAVIARRRDHRNTLAIFMVALLLGWTVFGWIAALIWACTDNTKAKEKAA